MVAILVFCSFVHLFFYEQNDKTEKLISPERTKVVLTARDLISMDISKMLELEFRITIIKILAGLEKDINNTRESPSGEIKELKSNQVKIKKVINEIQ